MATSTSASSVEKLLARLEDVGVKQECPACGQTGMRRTAEHLVVIPGARLRKAYPTLMVYCGRCGFVQQHVAEVLEQDPTDTKSLQ